MQLSGQILTGSTQTIATKKGDHLQKTRLKVLDLGPEANGGDVYWIDFLGDAALTDEELRQVSRQQVKRRGATDVRLGGQDWWGVPQCFGWRGHSQRPDRAEETALRSGSVGVSESHWGRSLAEWWLIPVHDKDVFEMARKDETLQPGLLAGAGLAGRSYGVLPALAWRTGGGAGAGREHDGGPTALQLGGAVGPEQSLPLGLSHLLGGLLDGGLCPL